MVSEFADVVHDRPDYPRVVFVYQGSSDQGSMFFDPLFADAVAIADPDRRLFDAFGVERGGLREMFGLRTSAAGFRATLRGHMVNRTIGDPWTLPTIVAIRSGHVIGEFRGRHAGDHPDLTRLPRDLGLE